MRCGEQGIAQRCFCCRSRSGKAAQEGSYWGKEYDAFNGGRGEPVTERNSTEFRRWGRRASPKNKKFVKTRESREMHVHRGCSDTAQVSSPEGRREHFRPPDILRPAPTQPHPHMYSFLARLPGLSFITLIDPVHLTAPSKSGPPLCWEGTLLCIDLIRPCLYLPSLSFHIRPSAPIIQLPPLHQPLATIHRPVVHLETIQ